MRTLTVLVPIMLVACVSRPALPPAAPVEQEVRSVIATDNLAGRWLIEAVNRQPTNNLWLELGGQGSVIITSRPDGGVNIGSPQPPTNAFLGCNDLHLTGWTRNGDKLSLGLEGSRRTERGCDTDTMAIEQQAYEILRKAMTMEFKSPDHLRLINEVGTLSLRRTVAAR